MSKEKIKYVLEISLKKYVQDKEGVGSFADGLYITTTVDEHVAKDYVDQISLLKARKVCEERDGFFQ